VTPRDFARRKKQKNAGIAGFFVPFSFMR